MGELSDEQLRNIMLNLYPVAQQTPAQLNSSATAKVLNDDDDDDDRYENNGHFVHPLMQKKQGQKNMSKWGYSLLLAIVSTFLFSNVFLNMLDDLCSKKEISVFDMNGNPKPFLIAVLFAIIFIVNRIIFELM
jgi:hypothetical protein